jgi:hypothetical protein
VDCLTYGQTLEWKEVATLQLGAIGGERVNFVRAVEASEEAFRVPSRAVAADYDHVSVPGRPFALDSYERWTKVEDEVVSLVTQRSGDADSELERGVGDRRLRDCALLVGRKHDRILVF